MKTQRPPALTVAAILLALLSLPSLAFPLFASEGVPAFVVCSNVVLGVLGLFAAGGLLTPGRWAVRITFVLCVLGVLLAAPGVVEAPTALLRVVAAAGIAASILIVLLVTLSSSRRAYA